RSPSLGPTAPRVTVNGGDGSGGDGGGPPFTTSSAYDPGAMPVGSTATMSVFVALTTVSTTPASVTSGALPKFVPEMKRWLSELSASACVTAGITGFAADAMDTAPSSRATTRIGMRHIHASLFAR